MTPPLSVSTHVDEEAMGGEELIDHWHEGGLQGGLVVATLADTMEVETHHLCTVGLVRGETHVWCDG